MIKTVILPLLILMYLSLGTSSFGQPASQLSNLIAVYLAYGQFIIVMNDKTIDQKELSIADIINMGGILINVIQ